MRAKLFRNGCSQAVRLPASCRFEGTEVEVQRDEHSGVVTLTPIRSTPLEWLRGAVKCWRATPKPVSTRCLTHWTEAKPLGSVTGLEATVRDRQECAARSCRKGITLNQTRLTADQAFSQVNNLSSRHWNA